MTSSANDFDAIFAGAPLMAIFRGMGVDRALSLAEKAWDLGIDAIEIPIQTSKDEDTLRIMAERAAERGRIVGAGTIVSRERLDRAQQLGARYLVSPGLDSELVQAARDLDIPFLPGVATPTDVQRATALGLTWLKAFPARWLGPGWFSLMRGPFPDIRFVATGGLDASNVSEFLAAGVRVAAVGSALEDPEQLVLLSSLFASSSA